MSPLLDLTFRMLFTRSINLCLLLVIFILSSFVILSKILKDHLHVGYSFPKHYLYNLWNTMMLIGQDIQILVGLLAVDVYFLIMP